MVHCVLLKMRGQRNKTCGFHVMLINQFILPLEQNEIWEINSDDLFCDLPSLMDLHLGKSRNSRNNPPPPGRIVNNCVIYVQVLVHVP